MFEHECKDCCIPLHVCWKHVYYEWNVEAILQNMSIFGYNIYFNLAAEILCAGVITLANQDKLHCKVINIFQYQIFPK